MTLDPTELAARYALLCRSTQATAPADDSQALRVGPHLSALRTLLQHDLRALGRQGSPDDFADICFELDHELERFEEFCAFPALAQKFVVAFGGGFSAGKSSLINALLVKRLLVTEVDPTTSLPTYLLQGDEDAIHALNLFGHRIHLSEEEFLSLTHDEIERYGSNVSRLLHSAIISRRDFPWQHLALIDTPGYTKHEDKRHSARTDEHIARTQLNSAQAIVWVIDARQGCITEEDINFLASLRPDIPRLFALSRADQKPAEDIDAIVAGIRTTLETRNLPFIDVVAVSARSKKWLPTPIIEQLNQWSGNKRELRFAHNFKHQFTRYARHLDDERRQAQQHLNRLNRILALADEPAIQQDAQELKQRAEGVLHSCERVRDELDTLRHQFFSRLKTIGNHVGIPLPEPSELDLLDHAPGFDLLQALRQIREAEGKPLPDEPATLRELAQPGDTPKITAYLNGETQQAMAAHFAAELDTHSKEAYARLLAAVACHGRAVLTDMQSTLLLKLLKTLELSDIRTTLLSQVHAMDEVDFQECCRIVNEHDLENVIFFDALTLCRAGGKIDEDKISLFNEFCCRFNIEAKIAAGMPALAGYVIGLHDRIAYTSSKVLELVHWHPLFFKKIEKSDYKNGYLNGYFQQKKDIKIRQEKSLKINAVIICDDGIRIILENPCEIENTTISSKDYIWIEGERVTLVDSLIFSENDSITLTGASILMNRTKILSARLNGHKLLYFAGKSKILDSIIENYWVKFEKSSVEIENSSFTNCDEIQFNCSEISNILINKCTFTKKSVGPALKMQSDSSIYTPPNCTASLQDSTFIYLDNDEYDGVVLELEERGIEKRGFYDKLEINIARTNIQRGEINTSSTLEIVRKFEPKYKYTGFEGITKTISFIKSQHQ